MDGRDIQAERPRQSLRARSIGHTRLLELLHEAQHLRLWAFSSRALEAEYASWVRAQNAQARKALMCVPFVAMVLAPIYGMLLLDSRAPAVFWLRVIEFGVAAPVCGLSIYLLHRHPERPWTTRWMLIAAVVVFAAVAAVRWVGALAGGTLSPELVMVVPLALAAVGRLRLFLILPMILGCSLVFLGLEWAINGLSHLASATLGTVLFGGLAAMTAISTDRLSRRNWLSRGVIELTAMSDALTGLPNRQWLNRDLEAVFALARRQSQPLAVMMLDLDHFKKLNDTHGHAAGDAALAAVGGLLAGYGRRAMDLAARFGGEEFVLVLHNPTLEGTERIARRLIEDVAALGLANEAAPGGLVTASLGACFGIPGGEDRPETFLAAADAALYAAKRAGRNRYRLVRAAASWVPAETDAEAADSAIPPT
jgi:diguanylate cyclase (GGDEF)-like protein